MSSTRRFCAWLLSCLCLIMLLAACSPSSTQPISSTAQRKSTPTLTLGALHCRPPSPITSSAIGLPEVRGTTSGQTELWALLFQPLVAKQELKIVWRMTGDGDIRVVAKGPQGASIQPKWITFHGSSNWSRPGAEWGTGFILPRSGCWNFHVSRGDASGDVWLLVK